MKRHLPHLLAVAGLASCASSASHLPDGELGRQFTATVPGTWNEEIRRGSAIMDGEKTFYRDGSAHGSLSLKERGHGLSVVLPAITFRSKWRVEGDTYISYDVKSPRLDAFAPGTIYRDRILSVSPNRIVCRSEEDGRVFTMNRTR
jgi:hypothetical protein